MYSLCRKTIMHFYSFSTASNPCLRMPCDFMCLLNPAGARCTCPEGKVLINGTCADAIVSGRPVPGTFGPSFMNRGRMRHLNNKGTRWSNSRFSHDWRHKREVDVWWRLCGCEGELCRPPCENGGRCLANEKGDGRCYCWPDFSGERCEVNHCTDYCLNGGTCMGSPLGRSTSNTMKLLDGPLSILGFINKANKPTVMQHALQTSSVPNGRKHLHAFVQCRAKFCSVGVLPQGCVSRQGLSKRQLWNYIWFLMCWKKHVALSILGWVDLSLLAFARNAGN